MTHHDVDTQNVRSLNHVDATGPQGCARALPQVTAIERQGVLTTACLVTKLVQQCFNVSKATGTTKLLGLLEEVQIGVGIGLR